MRQEPFQSPRTWSLPDRSLENMEQHPWGSGARGFQGRRQVGGEEEGQGGGAELRSQWSEGELGACLVHGQQGESECGVYKEEE